MILAKWLKILRAVQEPFENTVTAAARLISHHPEYTDVDQKEIMEAAREMDYREATALDGSE